MAELKGLEEANQIIQRYLSPRYLKLDRFERFAHGTQYDHLPNWFEESDVPLWNRAPCIVYPIVETAVRSNVDLVLGESRFPDITSNPGEDDSDFSETGLDEEQSEVLDRFMQEVERQSRFRKVAREMLHAAQTCGTAVSILGVRNGLLFVEACKAKWCTVDEDDETGAVTRLVIEYPYTTQVKVGSHWQVKPMLYRRVIDTESDTIFNPADARVDGVEPNWTVKQSVAHGFGFCPVVWYRFDARCSIVGDPDGRPIHSHLLDEIQGLDFVLSQRHRAVLFLGDPQLIEIGVEHGSNPGQSGRAADPLMTAAGGAPTAADGPNPVRGSFPALGQRALRRKSPGQVWQYESEKVKVELLTLPAEALKALDDNAKDLRNKIAEALAVVLIDPQDISHTRELSGKALEVIKQRQIDRCDVIRDDFGHGWILPVMRMMLQIVRIKSSGLRLAGLQKSMPFVTKIGDATGLCLRWPSYYTPNAQDEQFIVALTAQAKEAGIISTRMAVEKVKDIFGITNVDQAVDSVEEEQDEILSQMQGAAGDVGNDGGLRKDGARVRGVSDGSAGRKAGGKAGSGSSSGPRASGPKKA